MRTQPELGSLQCITIAKNTLRYKKIEHRAHQEDQAASNTRATALPAGPRQRLLPLKGRTWTETSKLGSTPPGPAPAALLHMGDARPPG